MQKIVTQATNRIEPSSLCKMLLKIGAQSFGGWSTTVVLLERELQERQLDKIVDLKAATAYAQVLPGATQISIVSNVGYQLKVIQGAFIATAAYLTPSILLMIAFAAIYFGYLKGTVLTSQLDGLTAALAGVILANAYKIGSKHTSRSILWLAVIAAAAGQLLLGIHALAILLIYAVIGLLLSFGQRKNLSDA